MQKHEEEEIKSGLREEHAIFVDVGAQEQSKKASPQLLQLDFNFSSLNDYLGNIIHVINQHAKIVNSVQRDVRARMTQRQVTELMTMLCNSLPDRFHPEMPSKRSSRTPVLSEETERLMATLRALGSKTSACLTQHRLVRIRAD